MFKFNIQGRIMRITKKCSLEEEVERFTHVLQREISFFSAKKARSIFVQCLGYDSFEKLLSEFPIMLNEKTQIKSSPLAITDSFAISDAQQVKQVISPSC